MIFRIVTGGLGNQLFQMFAGKSIAKKRNLPVRFHVERATRDYMLDQLGLDVELVDRPRGPVYEEPGFAFDPGVYSGPEDAYYRGYWQSWKYLDEELVRKELSSFKFNNNLDVNSVFVHIRRGDYLNPGTRDFHGVNLDEYYGRATEYIKEKVDNPRFIIFSDDPQWCATHMPEYASAVNNGFSAKDDLYRMSQCKHGITANSSFSWWANWLGDHPDRICISPKEWFVDKTTNTNDLCPPHWIRL